MSDTITVELTRSVYTRPTNGLRLVPRQETIMGRDRDGEPVGVGSRPVLVLQQAWELLDFTTDGKPVPYEIEWRDVPIVDEQV